MRRAELARAASRTWLRHEEGPAAGLCRRNGAISTSSPLLIRVVAQSPRVLPPSPEVIKGSYEATLNRQLRSAVNERARFLDEALPTAITVTRGRQLSSAARAPWTA